MDQITISIKKTPELSAIIPGSVWSVNKPTKIFFRDFSPLSNKLNSKKVFTSVVQEKCYQRFLRYPNKPQTYVISSNPDYSKALLFAAHLVEYFIKKYSSNKVLWYSLSRFSSINLDTISYKPSLIVVSTIYPDTSVYRKEIVRDIISSFWNVPKLIIGSGIDPISIAADVLNIPANSVFYYEASSLVESKVKVI